MNAGIHIWFLYMSALEILGSWGSETFPTFFHEYTCVPVFDSENMTMVPYYSNFSTYQSLSRDWSLNNFQVSCSSQYPPPMGEVSTMVHTGPSFPCQQITFSLSSIKVSFHQKKPEVTSLKKMCYWVGFYWCPVSKACIFSCSQECGWFFCWSGFIYDEWPMSIKGTAGVWGLKLWVRS